MITRLSHYISYNKNPYQNFATEKYFFDHVGDDEMILFLWQNKNTIVCGRNQNVWKECRVSKLINDGAYITRRLSGGGCVFHDDGNLNFTFICKKSNYRLKSQMDVIKLACKELGLKAEVNGRNDVTINGKKFSGNAFYERKDTIYHHGTIMIDVNTFLLADYLNVDKTKLESKGVLSVTSRVCNLKELRPDLDVDMMIEALLKAFEKKYHNTSEAVKEVFFDNKELEKETANFSSKDWIFGRNLKFTFKTSERFEWGDFDLNINADSGVIKDCIIYSDALDEAFIKRVSYAFENKEFNYEVLKEALEETITNRAEKKMCKDIEKLLYENI